MWQDRAACVGHPTDLFFPESGESPKEAKKICKRCPVTQECLTFALKHEEGTTRHGIYGALTQSERGELHRRKAA